MARTPYKQKPLIAIARRLKAERDQASPPRAVVTSDSPHERVSASHNHPRPVPPG